MMDVNKYLVAAIILTTLFLILWKCNRIMKLNIKAVGYFFILGVYAILIVIGTNGILCLSKQQGTARSNSTQHGLLLCWRTEQQSAANRY